jgi:hypothetical protein
MKKLFTLITLLFISSLAFSQITITSTVTNVSCFGLSNGSATVTASGGSGAPYTYTLFSSPFPTNSTGVFTGLVAGTYSLSISDASANTTSTFVTITQPNQINIATTQTNVTCNGLCDAAINTITTGGTLPYVSWIWNIPTAPTLPNITNVCPGNWMVSVTDINGCTSSQNVTITQPSQLNAIVNANNVRCFGTSTGTVTAAGTGGTAPYTYLWPSIPSTLASIPNVAIGTYTVIVTDANGCVTSNSISVLQPTQLIATTTVTNANCGQADGSICANVTGGTVGPYTYLWNNLSTTQCLSLVPAGNYSVTVTDANLCAILHVGTVSNIGGPTVSITSQTNVSCFGSCNGALTTSITSGTGPFSYSWSNGATIPNATNLCAGFYNISVTDFFGCVGTASVNISQPQPLNIAITAANNTCFGTCNGSASVVAMGGTPGYTFIWNTAPSQSGPTINNVCPGNWSCVVTDMNGCTGTASVNIGQTAPLITNITKTDVTCGGNCDGQAFANVSGGSGAFTFLWLPTLQTGNTANGLCAGQYSLNVTDQNGCVTTENFVIANQGISAITNATLTTTVINETCLLTNDGGIDLTINGTNPGPFTYQWSNGATTQDITNIPTGSYNVTVFDASLNCLSISSNVSATGTNCGTISGNVFIDNNSDCIKNSGDNNSNNTLVIANPGNRIGYTNFNGDYVFYNLPFATYTITSSTTANMLATCVTTLNTTLNSGTPNSINNNFAKEYIPITQPDLQVSAYSNGIVPGFVCYVNYYISNLNNIPATGLFKAVLPSAFIPNITTGNPNTYSISGDTVIWNFNNITNLTGYNYFTINFTVPLSTPLGSIFTSCMWAQPNIADLNYANNTYCYQRLVTGSYRS